MKKKLVDLLVAKDLIPIGYKMGQVRTMEDFYFLGSGNINALKVFWRQEERFLLKEIKDVQKVLDILNGCKTPEELDDLAEKVSEDMLDRYAFLSPSWKPASRRIEPKSTTFSYCGWCQYHSFKGICILMQEDEEGNKNLNYRTSCLIANGDAERLERCKEHLKGRLAELLQQKTEVGRKLRLIMASLKTIGEESALVEKKPAFPPYRTKKYFEVGDRVVYFSRKSTGEYLFVHGTVEESQFKNRYLKIHLDEPVMDKVIIVSDYDSWVKRQYSETGVVYVDVLKPIVMHEWEHYYLISNPSYCLKWVNACFAANSFRELPDRYDYQLCKKLGVAQ